MKKKEKKVETIKFAESLSFSIQEGTIDEEKHTVKVCALAPCVSKNNRYYSPKVVEGASGTLVGKKCFADHDVRDTKNLIGKIVSESYKNGRLYADIKLSKAKGIARETWDKISDGTITDVSIAANGTEKRVRLGDKIVSEVSNLDIRSVDFVPEGGVAEAKVQQVFENIKDIPEISEVKEEMTIENLDQLIEQYPDLVAEAVAKKDEEIATLKKEKEDAEFKLVEKELAEYKASEIAKLEVNDKVKAIISEKVSGKTNEEISASIKAELESIKKYEEALKPVAKVTGVAEIKKEEKVEAPKPWTKDRIMEEEKIPETLKVEACEMLVLEGSKAMLEWLKGKKIEL